MTRFLLVILAVLASSVIFAQEWVKVDPLGVRSQGERLIQPKKFVLAQIDDAIINEKLSDAPQELNRDRTRTATIRVMLADESMDDFEIVEYKMMEDELSRKFPDIKTFRGQSNSNPYRSIRIDQTLNGFRAVISDETGKTYIDPYQTGDRSHRIIYKKKDLDTDGDWICHAENPIYEKNESVNRDPIGSCDLRTFRIACAATAEYTAFHGGATQAIAAIVTAYNRLNEIYEQDIHATFVLVANNDLIIYTNANTDPYTNNDAFTMLAENQTNITNVIGAANYDVGHVFATSFGGIAASPSICNDNLKARGVTGRPSPTGDPFWIDFVAHEIGHQFGAPHTFNGTEGSCADDNRNTDTAYEPGSGTTIMAYAGICGDNDDVQDNSDAYFLGKSIERMVLIAENSGCGTTVDLGNSHPDIPPLSGFTVPISTSLVLETLATDPDGDNLTYCWEQVDNEVDFAIPPQSGNVGGAMFRSLLPTPSPKRYLPNLDAIISNTTPKWEVLPSVERSMEFQLTVRDHALTPGCTATRSMTIQVEGDAGPFLVTNSSIPVTVVEGQTIPLVWDVAGTDIAPVNCSNVDVYMSTDGGLTYGSNPILSATTNDGMADVVIPEGLTTTARLMVKCSDNIFFDINDSDFEVTAGGDGFTINLNPVSASICNDGSIMFTIETNEIGSFATPINLSVTGLPFDATSTFSTNPITPGSSSVVTLDNFGSNIGDFTLEVTGTAGAISRMQNYLLTLSGPPSAPSLSSPANNAIDVSQPLLLQWDPAANADDYDVEVSTSPNGVGLVFAANVTSNSVSISGLDSEVQYYWRVRSNNSCGSSAFSAEFTFTTAAVTEVCTTFSTSGTPLAIADAGEASAQTNAFITVSGISGPITDVNVLNLAGDHTRVSDLFMAIFSPNGSATQVNLFAFVCGIDDDFDLNFDDEASQGGIPCPPTAGTTHQPLTSLSTWDGQNPNGVWQLAILDVLSDQAGTLNSWSLEVCYDGEPPLCDLEVVSTAGMGAGTLSNAISCASTGDVITLNTGLNSIIELGSDGLTIGKDLTIQASPSDNIIIRYSGSEAALEVLGNSNLILSGINFEKIDALREVRSIDLKSYRERGK